MRKSRVLGTLAAAGTILAGTVIAAPAANAHGYISGPDSRALLCQARVNTGCGAVMYEPQSLEGRQGYPAGGPEDGRIASGGTYIGEGLNDQSVDRWHKNKVNTGPLKIDWGYTAAHRTRKWHYYLTKVGWDPNDKLERSDFVHLLTVEHDGSSPDDKKHTVIIPEDRNGYHVLLGVWDIYDTSGAFYQVVDLDVQGNPTPDTQAPTAPANVRASQTTSTATTVAWNAASDDRGVSEYRIYRDGVQVGTTSSTSYRNTGLTGGQTYRYTVQAVDAAGNVSGHSAELSVTTPATPAVDTQAPSTPAGVHTMSVTSSSVALMWNPSTDNVAVSEYVVFRNGNQVGRTGSTNYTDSGLKPDTTYRYTVRAMDAAGNTSAASSEFAVRTSAEPTPDPEPDPEPSPEPTPEPTPSQNPLQRWLAKVMKMIFSWF